MKKIIVLIIIGLLCLLSACAPEFQIQKSIKETNKACPMYIDEGVSVKRVFLEGKDIVYECEMNEGKTELTLNDVKTGFEERNYKSGIINSFKLQLGEQERGTELLKNIKEGNYNLVYRFRGVASGESLDLRIGSSEL